MSRSIERAVLRVVVPYALVAGLWILFSDRALEALVDDPEALARWSTVKGWGFVLVTAALLAWLLRAELAERERAHAELRQSEERLRLALDAARLGTFEWEFASDRTRWSPRHEAIWGYAPGEYRGTHEEFERRVHPEDLPGIRAAVERTLATRERFAHEFRIVWPDGSVHWVRSQGEIAPEHGEPRRLRGVVAEITESKRREEQLRELLRVIQQLATAHDREAIGAAVTAAARRLVAAEGATFALREGEAWHVVGEAGASLLWKGERSPVGDGVAERVMSEREPLVVEDLARAPGLSGESPESAPVRGLAAVPVRVGDPIGAIVVYWARPRRLPPEQVRLLGTLADATSIAVDNVRSLAELERQVAERTAELSRAVARAEAADRLKSAFLATMSHELRTPLNSVIGFTGILLQELAGPINAEQRKQLGMVQASARHLLALINDVLDLSKIEAGQLQVHVEPFDLRETIERAVASVRPQAEAKGLALAAEIAPEVGGLASDARRVEQILLNLLNNAIKFTERGEVRLTAGVAGEWVRIAVADTGMGIRPEDLAKLFRPFQQLDVGLARNHEGTGLGLAICRRLAGLLDGEVTAESEWGRGSRFVLSLPDRREVPA